MGFWILFEVALTPILQILIVGGVGAFTASGYCNILNADARRYMNKVVFIVFIPCLVFANLAETVTWREVITWWFMPVNISLVFLFGGILGWTIVKLFKPDSRIKNLVIATCSAGNFGNLMLILVPAVCKERGSPFGDAGTCNAHGLSYSSFSMALGGLYIWTYTYHLIKAAGEENHQHPTGHRKTTLAPNLKLEADASVHLLIAENGGSQNCQEEAIMPFPSKTSDNQAIVEMHVQLGPERKQLWVKIRGILCQIVDELLAPPTIGAILGFVIGVFPWLKSLLIGTDASLRVIQDSIKLLGDGAIPCTTLILGGNITSGVQSGALKPPVIVAVIMVRYMIMPIIGVAVVKTASKLSFLSADPLYKFVLMLQFTLPPAMSIGTMTQLFDVGQNDCSVLFLWTYVVASAALTIWSTFYMWILT